MRITGNGSPLFFLLLLVGCGWGRTTPPPPVFGQPASQALPLQLGPAVGKMFQILGQGADADCQALSYAWDFDGDGTVDSTDQSPMHSFSSEGAHTCGCTVTDAAGHTGESSCVIVAGSPASAAPAVSLRCYSLLCETGLETYFVASGFDLDAGTVTSFDWDFDGDGTFDLNDPVGVGSLQTHTYNTTGQVTPRVRANSDDGGASIATMTIYLCEANSMPQYGAGVQIEGRFSRFVPLGIAQNYLGTTVDPSGGPVTQEWDLDGDGMYSDGTGFEVTSAPLTNEGAVAIRLRATDAAGNESTAEYSQVVFDADAPALDHPPLAQALACTLVGSLDTPIQFLGVGADRETPVTFSWDLDGDGIEDSTDRNPSFTYTERGLYTPTMRVEDGTGNVSEAHLSLVIECCEVDGGAPPPSQWFKCACNPIAMGHGGTGTLNITCVSMGTIPSLPTQSELSSCNGGFAFGGVFGAPDPNCNDITTAPIVMGGALGGGPAPAPFTLTVTSTGVDGPQHAVPYTFGIRLRDPGVMSINKKCYAWVIHNWVQASCSVFGSAPNFTCNMQVEVAPSGANLFVPGPGELMPQIVEIRLVHAQQLPPWASSALNLTLPGTPSEWVQLSNPNALQLSLLDPPGSPAIEPGFQFPFQFGYQSPNPPSPPMMPIEFYDASGTRVAVEEMPVGP